MNINIEILSDYLSQILSDDFQLSLSETDKYDAPEDKSIVYGLVCLHEDLQYYKTRSKLTIDNLKKALFNSAAVTITNNNQVITEVNSLFLKISGYNEEEVVGQTCDFFNSLEHDEAYHKNLTDTINSGTVWRGELCNKKKNGDIYWVHTNIFPIKDHKGVIHEFWSIRTDITEKKKVELELAKKNKELEEAVKIKDYLIKEMHHRIKNNLQFLSSMLSIKSRLGNEREADFIKEIIDRINSISSLHEILYQKAEHKNINLKEYIDKTFNVSHFNLNSNLKIQGKNLITSIETCSYLGVIINELITNSNKYAWKNNPFSNKQIYLSYTEKDNSLIINYGDNGTGFAKNNIKPGLGTTLISKLITKQLNGTYQENHQNGYSIEICIPKQKELQIR